jgi:hypothetical protein
MCSKQPECWYWVSDEWHFVYSQITGVGLQLRWIRHVNFYDYCRYEICLFYQLAVCSGCKSTPEAALGVQICRLIRNYIHVKTTRMRPHTILSK